MHAGGVQGIVSMPCQPDPAIDASASVCNWGVLQPRGTMITQMGHDLVLLHGKNQQHACAKRSIVPISVAMSDTAYLPIQ